jgi:alpha-galactosidase
MFRRLVVCLSMLLVLAGGAARADPRAANTTTPIALTPPMGFNNWARFQCLPQRPLDGRAVAGYGFQDFMLDQGKALAATGLARAGYRFVVVDDCWMERADDGGLVGAAHWGSYKHPSGQPGFDRGLTGYVTQLHALGLEGGVYNTAGAATCQRVAAGEAGHQQADARRFAAWGVDFLKLDNCGASDAELPGLFAAMSHALADATAATNHKILFDESAPAQYAPTDPAKYRAMDWVRPLGQMWRVAPDIRITHIGADGRSLYDPWSFNDAAQGYEEGVYQAFTDTVALSRYVSPGNWNDADQLLIGDSGLTTAEERSQMGLWSIMGAPLIVSADLRRLARERTDPHFAAALAILGNPRAIAIDQDPLGAGGYRVLRDHSADDVGVDVALKPLADGGFAVLVLNKGPTPIDYALPLARLGVDPADCALTATDVWTGVTGRVDAGGALRAHIASHDNSLTRIAPAACLRWTPGGQIAVAQAEFASPPLCLEAADDGGVTVESCSAGARQQWRMEVDGHIRMPGAGACLAAAAAGAQVNAAACAASPAQTFAYHRGGALIAASGLCLAVDTGAVGNGGLIGQQGAAVRAQPCKPFAPEQIFSAPHIGSPPA